MNMKNSYFTLILITLAITGCRGTAGRNNAENADGTKVEVSSGPDRKMTAPLEEAILLPSVEGVVNPVLLDGARKVTIRKTAGKKVYADFEADGYTHLHAVIAPVGTTEANLRISMITLPGGATDGPFGREIDYDIPSSGTIRLEIGESMMQGDEWGGDFTLDIRLTK